MWDESPYHEPNFTGSLKPESYLNIHPARLRGMPHALRFHAKTKRSARKFVKLYHKHFFGLKLKKNDIIVRAD